MIVFFRSCLLPVFVYLHVCACSVGVQGWNPSLLFLLHWQADPLPQSHLGSHLVHLLYQLHREECIPNCSFSQLSCSPLSCPVVARPACLDGSVSFRSLSDSAFGGYLPCTWGRVQAPHWDLFQLLPFTWYPWAFSEDPWERVGE